MSLDGTKMPKLGFGLMRLPQKDDKIDIPQLCDMVDLYLKSGFNYFDTAFVYHNGASETAINEALIERHPRDAFFLADKLPLWMVTNAEAKDKIFSEQLKKTGAGHFDFYLLHSLEDGGIYDNCINYNCFDWGKQKKAEGLIRNFGFSFHGSPELLEKVVTEHTEIDFVMIQLNYADWKNPIVHSGALYEILLKHKIPTIAMEPVKGGMLASLPEEIETQMKKMRPNSSIASWGLRFAGSLENVVTVLSGMSSIEQMKDNLETFANFEPIQNDEKPILDKVVEAMAKMPTIPCTNCRYCVDGDNCSKNIAIPEVFKALNTVRMYGEHMRPQFFYNNLAAKGGRAKDCIECGQCEKICPQHLPVIKLLKEASEQFDKEQ